MTPTQEAVLVKTSQRWKGKLERETQSFTMVRVEERRSTGGRVSLVWHAGDQSFTGRSCHMHALKAARENGRSRTVRV
jgi:hypothetical protein